MKATYVIHPGQIVAVENGAHHPIPLLGWAGRPDRALSVLCHALGEKPTPKQLAAERFQAAGLLPGFRRQFACGLDLLPGQQIKGDALAEWLRERGALQ